MNEQIENIRLRFACDANWDSMEYVDGVKHCTHCKKKVYDFTNAKQNEFLKILAESDNSICGRFNPQQMVPNHYVLPAWKKWVSAALVLIGINVFSTKAHAQNTVSKSAKHSANINDNLPVMGAPIVLGDTNNLLSANNKYPDYDQPARFVGSSTMYMKFLKRNLHYKEGMINGRVFVSFDVNTNGALSNYKIGRSLSPLNDEEALRVLKLSPKWKPAMFKGKPVLSTYAIPIIFQK